MSSTDYRRNLGHEYVTISNVDTARDIVTATDQYGQLIYVSLDQVGAVVQVPIPGERWMARRQNSIWFLISRIDSGEETTNRSGLDPGDTRLETKGKLFINASQIYTNGDDLMAVIADLQARLAILEGSSGLYGR